ncbi:efflux transporter outer membrane subunit [Desulfosarcina ovata]|uniref:RND transporter n=1 Tax=Desulfosarcina ovata subsp. ovata TaxID=2752305 RepID=A0A5K8A9P8_9BACT|nr:TolC family protein [Desulfosarcina ovata]BBO89209.1 hypothetical protein DSCOOX_23890 [Desulfosarcina ovata subsp. ovata]
MRPSDHRKWFFPYRSLVLFAAWLLVVAGCTTVGPDYETPDLSGQHHADWIAHPQHAETTSLTPSTPANRWWTQFEDVALERLVGRLFASNIDLAEARQCIVEARARRGIVNADRLPQVDVEAAMRTAGTGEEALNFQGPSPGEEIDVYSVGALAGWELDLWGRVARLAEAADRDIEAQYGDYGHARVSLAAELALGYVDARALEARLCLLDRQLGLLEKSLQLSRLCRQVGSGTELALMQVQQRLDQIRSKRPELVRARGVAMHRIAVLIGTPPTKELIPPGTLPKPPHMIGIGLPADLITRRADVRRAEMQYAAAVARVGAAVADRYPRLSLSGSLYFQTDSADGIFDMDALIYSLGPGLRFPLFDSGQIKQTIRVRESQAEQARLHLQGTLLKAVGEVEDAAVGVVQNQQRVAHLRQTDKDARRQVELAEQRYDAGLESLIQVIDAQCDRVTVEDALIIARQHQLGGIIRLYRALGGGWETTAPGRAAFAAIQGGDRR